MPKSVVFTGGGSAGHVTPNLALFPYVTKLNAKIHYIGSKNGIEKDIVGKTDVPYYPISSGKLRRYFSLKNFTDPFRILAGYSQAKKILKKIKPDVVFSKGGFVTVPVVYAAHSLNIPVILHESDFTPGLANKLNMKKADKICVSFEDTLKHVGSKGVYTGTPLRQELFLGDKAKGLSFLGFKGEKSVLLIMGGSLGAVAINEAVERELSKLTEVFDIAHIRGAGNINPKVDVSGYRQFEFLSEELPHVFAATDVMLSRSGANAVFEILALKKPALLVPLSLSASRGDQILNAKYCEKKGYAKVLPQEELQNLYPELLSLYAARSGFAAKLSELDLSQAAKNIAELIGAYVK